MKKIDTEENHITNSSERHLRFVCRKDGTMHVLTVSVDGLMIQECNNGILTSNDRFHNKWGGQNVGDIQNDTSGDITVASHKNSELNIWTVGIS